MEIVGTIIIIAITLFGVAVVGGFLMILYAAMELVKGRDSDEL